MQDASKKDDQSSHESQPVFAAFAGTVLVRQGDEGCTCLYQCLRQSRINYLTEHLPPLQNSGSGLGGTRSQYRLLCWNLPAQQQRREIGGLVSPPPPLPPPFPPLHPFLDNNESMTVPSFCYSCQCQFASDQSVLTLNAAVQLRL